MHDITSVEDKKHYPLKKMDSSWIKVGINSDTVEWARSFGYYLAQKNLIDVNGRLIKQPNNKGKDEAKTSTPLSPSQLRKFFGEIKRVQASSYEKEKDSIILLKPKLAYAYGKEKDKDSKIKDFYEQLSVAISAIDSEANFKNFVKITEAIVAYHREREDTTKPKN